MTPKEAIFWVNDTKYIYENMNPDIQLSRLKCEAFVSAIQALEKQIAKPIVYRTEPIGGGIHGLFYECPNCKVDVRHVVKSDYLCNYCPECGQKVRWK